MLFSLKFCKISCKDILYFLLQRLLLVFRLFLEPLFVGRLVEYFPPLLDRVGCAGGVVSKGKLIAFCKPAYRLLTVCCVTGSRTLAYSFFFAILLA